MTINYIREQNLTRRNLSWLWCFLKFHHCHINMNTTKSSFIPLTWSSHHITWIDVSFDGSFKLSIACMQGDPPYVRKRWYMSNVLQCNALCQIRFLQQTAFIISTPCSKSSLFTHIPSTIKSLIWTIEQDSVDLFTYRNLNSSKWFPSADEDATEWSSWLRWFRFRWNLEQFRFA